MVDRRKFVYLKELIHGNLHTTASIEPRDIMHIHDRGKASYVRSSIVFFQLFAVPKVHFVHRRSTYTTAGESLKMSGRTSTMTVLTVAGLTVVGGFIAYAAYFDYKRRSDPSFRKKIRRFYSVFWLRMIAPLFVF